MRRKRTKQLIAILLSITIITLSAAKPYQEAKATGLEGGLLAGGAGAAMSNPIGLLILMGIVGGTALLLPNGQDIKESIESGEIKKAADKAKKDFVNYSTQALNNNVSASEQEVQNSAHAKAVIEDFLESASAGVVDTTSEAWGWFRDFCSDIKAALAANASKTMNGTVGMDISGIYNVTSNMQIEIDVDLSTAEEGKYFVGATGATAYSQAGDLYISICKDFGPFTSFCNTTGFRIRKRYLSVDQRLEDLGWKAGTWNNWSTYRPGEKVNEYKQANETLMLPTLDTDISMIVPAGTTDVPGVSNVNDYISIGSDLPYTRPEGAWDICDPNGKKGQISIGKDIPGKMGYDDWYDVLGGIANGEATWEQVANASDVIRIGSDADSPYSSDNADAWDVYVDGTIIGYDVTAEGDVVITFEDGRVITIPQEYVSGMEWVNEQDKAQELDKDTTFPVSGTLAYPLPGALEGNPTADPDPGGGGGGNVTVNPDVSDYTLDFRKLFPFCIPFDIYKAVKLLDATPTAPVVHYKFYLSKSKSYNIDLNLNKFNTVAAILRKMECLLFIIGLATATRRIYIRG